MWERAQTSALRRHCSHLLTRSLWPNASIQLRAAARPARFSLDSWLRSAEQVAMHACHCVHVTQRCKTIVRRFRDLPQRTFSIPPCFVVQAGIEIRIKLDIDGGHAVKQDQSWCQQTQPPAARSKRPATGTASGDDYNDDVMLTFERAPKSRTPKLSSR